MQNTIIDCYHLIHYKHYARMINNISLKSIKYLLNDFKGFHITLILQKIFLSQNINKLNYKIS